MPFKIFGAMPRNFVAISKLHHRSPLAKRRGLSFRDRPAARVCDLHSDSLATNALDGPRPGQSLAHQESHLTDGKSFGQKNRLSATVQMTRQNAERSPLFVVQL